MLRRAETGGTEGEVAVTLHPTLAGQPCTHEPKDPIAAFAHVCKHCGKDIEPQHCKTCDGTGSIRDRECRRCGGTGVKRWILLV